MLFKKILFLFIFPLLSVSQIMSFELIKTWSIPEIQDVYTFSALPDYVGEINYEVEGYKVTYLSFDENENLVINSGAIFLPVNPSCASPILSWQHGTVVSDLGVPSANIDDGNAIGVISASHGYVVVMSDYLGLGEGEGFHNYCHSETEASSVINLIIEGNNFSNSQSIETNGQVFLMGYSQGGHSTMATIKEIELNWSGLIDITASSPMAGPYSMSEAQSAMLDVVYPNPGYFPYVIFSYQNVYGNLYDNPDEIFKPGFENLFDMYNGLYSMTDINEEIWLIGQKTYNIPQEEFTPLDMIKSEYYVNYINDDNHPLHLALKDNDLIDFSPQSPMMLLHCNGDDNVPYENAVMAYNAFIGFGSENVSLLDGGNFNHSECALFSIISAKIWFDTMANFCGYSNLNDFQNNNKEVVKVVNFLGQNVHSNLNHNFIIKIYSDGSVQKLFMGF